MKPIDIQSVRFTPDASEAIVDLRGKPYRVVAGRFKVALMRAGVERRRFTLANGRWYAPGSVLPKTATMPMARPPARRPSHAGHSRGARA